MNNDFDFGFTLVSEQELRQHEDLLKQKIAEQEKTVVQASVEMQDKLHTLRNLIMPLLQNLAKDPSREYILWPNRAEKIQQFIKKIDDFVDNG